MSISPFTLYYAQPVNPIIFPSYTPDASYPVSNIMTRMDGTFWKSTTTNDQTIDFDCGSAYAADFFLVHGHNLTGSGIQILWSDNGSSFTACAYVQASNNKTVLQTFTSVSHRYWRISLTLLDEIPRIALVCFGSAVVLDYADAMTPENEEDHAIVTVSDNGITQGIHTVYKEIQLDVSFLDADDTVFNKVKTWRDAVGMGLFGVRWGTSDLGANECWMLRRKAGKFDAPLKVGGSYHDIKLSLIGRKE